ncbi:MAG: hypothetical protein ACXVAR_07575 [Vulcanimicrobiaceae bacterium]
MSDQKVVGKIGRVTATVGPEQVGEVMIPVRGGSEAFLARTDEENELRAGTRVVVIEYLPPRTVIVSGMP